MIQIKCNKCGKEFAITRDKCPYCNDPVKTSCKFYCGTCETKMKRGEVICKNCGEKPDEIIIEKNTGDKIKTGFNTEDSHTVMTDEEYNNNLLFKYIILPHIIFYIPTILITLLFLLQEPCDNNNKSTIWNCFLNSPSRLENSIFGLISGLLINYIVFSPGIPILIMFMIKYFENRKKINK